MGRYRGKKLLFKGVTLDQLKDDAYLDEALSQAIAQGWWQADQAARLQFHALAERSIRLGKNPGALFTHLVKERKVGQIAQEDERRALVRMKASRWTRTA